eukprot:8748837-Alexandrium_andersonii.AAC.1
MGLLMGCVLLAPALRSIRMRRHDPAPASEWQESTSISRLPHFCGQARVGIYESWLPWWQDL